MHDAAVKAASRVLCGDALGLGRPLTEVEWGRLSPDSRERWTSKARPIIAAFLRAVEPSSEALNAMMARRVLRASPSEVIAAALEKTASELEGR